MTVNVAIETTHPQARAARRLRMWAVADPDDAPAEVLAAVTAVLTAHAIVTGSIGQECRSCGPLPAAGACRVLSVLAASVGSVGVHG